MSPLDRTHERITAGPTRAVVVAALLWYGLALAGCAEPDNLEVGTGELRLAQERQYKGPAVGTVRIEVEAGEGRVLPVQLWYPATEKARKETARGRPLLDIEPEERERTLLEELLENAPEPGTSHLMHAADAPAPLRQRAPFPLIVFSHCTDCVRYSTLTIAEHLAGLGFVVAAPDHLKNTIYDRLEGTSVGLELSQFLPRRVADMTAVLDALLDPEATEIPEGLRGRIDEDRIGAYGHSFGGLTTGLLVQQDARVRAGIALAVHIAIPLGQEALYPNVHLADLESMTKPFMFIVAAEDFALFNASIDENFQRYPAEAWRATVRDTGHYSFTDICGMPPETAPGSCAAGPRQTDPSVIFEPLESDRARELAKEYVGAFFEKELLGRGRGPRGVPRRGDATLDHKR